MTSDLITVFGGSGFVGRYLVRSLAKRGYRVRAAVRRPNNANFLLPMGEVGQIQIIQANVRDEESVKRALHGANASINLVGILREFGKQKFTALHTEAADTIAKVAKSQGIGRLIHMSAIGADPEATSRYARSKGDGEVAVKAAFPDASIVRPSIVFGAEDEFFNRFAGMARLAPALPLIGGGKTRFQPVYVTDVAEAITSLIDRDDFKGRTLEFGGPRIYTFKELLALILAETNRSNALVTIPFPLASLTAALTGWLPFSPLTLDQVRLLRADNIVGLGDDPEIGVISDLGIAPTAVEAIVPHYLWRFRPHGEFEATHFG